MLKNRQEGLTTLQAIWVTIIIASLFLAYSRAVQAHEWLPRLKQTDLKIYFLAIVGGTLVSLRTYQRWASKLAALNWTQAIILTKQQMVRLTLVLLAFVFAYDTETQGITRLYLGVFLGIAAVALLLCNRFLPEAICGVVFKTNTMPTLMIGGRSSITRLHQWIGSKSNLGVDILGYLSDDDAMAMGDRCPVRFLGTVSQLDRVMRRQFVGQIILQQNYLDRAQTEQVVALAQKVGCRLHVFNNWAEEFSHPIVVDHEGEYTFFTLDDEPLENPINRFAKRALDLAIALPIVAFVIPPLTLAVWHFQQKQAPGPIFYTQPRSGMTRRPFSAIKFRTMTLRPTGSEPMPVGNENRIYRFGRFLRRTGLDALPQFINVLVGDMSVAGPSPHLLKHDDEFSQLLKSYYTRQFVKPGITGLAQCKGLRGEISDVSMLERRVRYDIFYINNWSILLDIEIMFRSAREIFFPSRPTP